MKPQIIRNFVVFEGGDGAGTSTQLDLLDKSLHKASIPHWITSEPTGNAEGLLIRRILSGELKRDPGTLARLYAADRNEHLLGQGAVLDRVKAGELVICDRYLFSSLAYQGITCGPELPRQLNEGFPLPELLLFFDIPPEVSMQRLGSRQSLDIFEKLSFQEQVRRAYQRIFTEYEDSGMKIIKIEAAQSREEVQASIHEALHACLGLNLDA